MPNNDLAPIFLSLYILGGLIGLAVGCLLNAIWLRVASQVLGFGPIPFLKAYVATLIGTLTVLSLNFAIGFNQGLAMIAVRGPRGFDPDDYFRMGIGSSVGIYSMIFGLVLMAVIYQCLLRKSPGEERLTFGEALALAAVQTAVALLFLIILGTTIMVLIALLASLA